MKANEFTNFPFLDDVPKLIELELSDNEYATEIEMRTFDKVPKLEILKMRNLAKVWNIGKDAFK
jgi:hypothetical protein